MTVASSDLDSSVTIGDKLVRTDEGVYLVMAGGPPVLLPDDDWAWDLPEGTRITVTSTSPVLFTADVPAPPQRRADLRGRNALRITTAALATPIATILAGLDTWAELVFGAPPSGPPPGAFWLPGFWTEGFWKDGFWRGM